jgi:acetyl esterase/lipase
VSRYRGDAVKLTTDGFFSFYSLADYQQVRRFMGEPDANSSKLLESTRFRPYKDQLYQKIVKENFTGYWMVQGDLESTQNPADSDIVIYFLHGGGYVAFSVSNYLPFLLAIWESIQAIKPAARVSIFALEYDVAPEVQFPGQLRQAAAGYDYLVGDLGIDPKKIIVSGNSAGGLSFPYTSSILY